MTFSLESGYSDFPKVAGMRVRNVVYLGNASEMKVFQQNLMLHPSFYTSLHPFFEYAFDGYRHMAWE